MNIRLTRTRLVVAIAAVVALVPATALATDVFDDVGDSKFYAAATEWAKDNNITTGSPAGSKTFKPDDPVTRGESVTFLNRYDTNVVQPAFADRLGRMEFQDIDLALTRGETKAVGSVDGVTVEITCADAGGGAVDIRLFITSDADGWYSPTTSPTVLSKTDVAEFIPLGVYVSAVEFASWAVDGFAIRTPNGGYIAIGAETTVIVLNSSVDTADCLFMGVYQYFDPPK